MPDTKVLKTPNGWIDDDDPNTFYRVRRLAREARRAKRAANRVVTRAARTTNVTVVGYRNSVTNAPAGQVALTSLQAKLLDRLTNKQGVSHDDAMDIITNNGYNKAASYGHMRAAGATHSEAKLVIDLSNPDISLAYGKAREAGDSHTDALAGALSDD